MQQKVVALGDNVAHKVGQAAVGITDVLAHFENNDFGVFSESAKASSSRHATGYSADNDDLHGFCCFLIYEIGRPERRQLAVPPEMLVTL